MEFSLHPGYDHDAARDLVRDLAYADTRKKYTPEQADALFKKYLFGDYIVLRREIDALITALRDGPVRSVNPAAADLLYAVNDAQKERRRLSAKAAENSRLRQERMA